MKLLLKASQERADFKELIGTEVTFASDIISCSGRISHTKGEKAVISEVIYRGGYWSRLCRDIWTPPALSAFQLQGMPHTDWVPNAFEEYRDHKR